MLIHRVDEGEELHLGMNWMSNKMTFLSLKFLIPFYLFYSKGYFYFSFRIRRWKNFPKKTNKVTFNFGVRPIGN